MNRKTKRAQRRKLKESLELGVMILTAIHLIVEIIEKVIDLFS